MADIKKELNEIKNAVYGREVRGSIHDGIKKINEESEESKQKAEEAYEITQDLLDETFDSAALEANFEQRLNDEIENLQPEWTQFKNDTVTQLTQTKEYAQNIKVINRYRIRPIVTIIDDDTRNELYTKLYPLAQTLNIPITSAAITSRIGVEPNYITIAQFEELRDSGIVEFISHAHTHKHLAELSDDEIEYELSESKKWLEQHGVSTRFVVYPFGSVNDKVFELTKKHYDGGFRTSSLAINELPLNTFEIVRSNFDKSIEELKQDVNNALDKKAWLVINTHAQYPDFTESKFTEFVNYVKSKDIEFMNVTDAFRVFANLLESESGIIDASGEGHGLLSAGLRFISNEGVTSSTPITFFKRDTISTCRFTGAEAQNAGFPDAGMLYVDRRSNDAYSRRYFEPLTSNLILKSKWNGSGWTSWELINPSAYKAPSDAVSSNTQPHQMSSLLRDNPFITKILRGNATGFPYNEPGILYTDVSRGAGFDYQIYHLFNSVAVFKRYHDGNDWSEFVKISNYQAGSNAIAFDTQPNEMTLDQRIHPFTTRITTAFASQFPEGRAGLLFTDVTQGAGFNYQIYQVHNSNNIYRRFHDGEAWSGFVKINA